MPGYNETSILQLGGDRWFASAQVSTTDLGTCFADLFRSDDNGMIWQGPERMTWPGKHNIHLVRLNDTRLLLSYGTYTKGQFEVMARWSSDDGRTWGEPVRLAHALSGYCSYRSSVQRTDGKVVTAYYS